MILGFSYCSIKSGARKRVAKAGLGYGLLTMSMKVSDEFAGSEILPLLGLRKPVGAVSGAAELG